ncbi:hypothetical protein Y032_0036g3200 [Ancylostoma ceylanicum]|nr:hypothetical protein Y032_0036g3200 [Ancylostoma ceylanicum]
MSDVIAAISLSSRLSRLAVTTFRSSDAFVQLQLYFGLALVGHCTFPRAACPAVPFPCHANAALRRAGTKDAYSLECSSPLVFIRSATPYRLLVPLMAYGSMMPPS